MLQQGNLTHITRHLTLRNSSEMTYYVSSGMLNPTQTLLTPVIKGKLLNKVLYWKKNIWMLHDEYMVTFPYNMLQQWPRGAISCNNCDNHSSDRCRCSVLTNIKTLWSPVVLLSPKQYKYDIICTNLTVWVCRRSKSQQWLTIGNYLIIGVLTYLYQTNHVMKYTHKLDPYLNVSFIILVTFVILEQLGALL